MNNSKQILISIHTLDAIVTKSIMKCKCCWCVAFLEIRKIANILTHVDAHMDPPYVWQWRRLTYSQPFVSFSPFCCQGQDYKTVQGHQYLNVHPSYLHSLWGFIVCLCYLSTNLIIENSLVTICLQVWKLKYLL